MWTRTQEQEGAYRFSGRALMTRGVQTSLSPDEIGSIVAILRDAVRASGGLDYLQVFKAEDGRVVWAIDDQTHWTLLLPEEY